MHSKQSWTLGNSPKACYMPGPIPSWMISCPASWLQHWWDYQIAIASRRCPKGPCGQQNNGEMPGKDVEVSGKVMEEGGRQG